jgi:hypothetical protein
MTKLLSCGPTDHGAAVARVQKERNALLKATQQMVRRTEPRHQGTGPLSATLQPR